MPKRSLLSWRAGWWYFVSQLKRQLAGGRGLFQLLVSALALFALLQSSGILEKVPKPALLLSVSEKTPALSLLLGHIEQGPLQTFFSIREMPTSEALALLDKRQALAVIEIQDDLETSLNRQIPAKISLHLVSKNSLTDFLVSYTQGLAQVLNEAQAGALVYWEVQERAAISPQQIRSSLQSMQLDYISLFLARERMFEDFADPDHRHSDPIAFYVTAALLAFGWLATYPSFDLFGQDKRQGIPARLALAGISWPAQLFGQWLAGTFWAFVSSAMAYLIARHFLLSAAFSSGWQSTAASLAALWMGALFASAISLLCALYAPSRAIQQGLFFGITGLLFISGGWLGRSFLSPLLEPIERVHPLSILHRQLLGHPPQTGFWVLFGFVLLGLLVLALSRDPLKSRKNGKSKIKGGEKG